MTLKAIETFLHFTDCLSFSETARRMDCTQPAAFAHISLLQEQMGRPLYWRDTNGLKLTRNGLRLATSLRIFQEQVAAYASELIPSIPRQPITLAASADITLFLLVPQLVQLFESQAGEREGEGFRLHLRAFEAPYALKHIRQGRTRLALLESQTEIPADLRATRVRSWPYVLCGRVGSEEELHASLLADLPLIAPPRPNRLRAAIEAWAGRLNVRLEVSVYELMLKFVDEGLGYAVVPAYCVGSRPHRPLDALGPTHLYLVERQHHTEGYELDVFKRAIIASIQSL